MIKRYFLCSVYLGLILFIGSSTIACRTIAYYDQQVYTYAISLKVECLAMIDKSTQSYAQNQPQTETLLRDIEKAYLYVQNIPKNKESVEQWKTVKDNFNSFAQIWQKNEVVGLKFAQNYKLMLGQYFDEIITLEAKKIRKR